MHSAARCRVGSLAAASSSENVIMSSSSCAVSVRIMRLEYHGEKEVSLADRAAQSRATRPEFEPRPDERSESVERVVLVFELEHCGRIAELVPPQMPVVVPRFHHVQHLVHERPPRARECDRPCPW